MSHTNSTTNYSLPQFVGTDKPAWLTDINGAFSTIDTNLKTVSDNATTAGTTATTASNNIGTLSSLTTTDKSNLVSAINENVTNIGTVSGVASQASSDATNAYTKVTALESALNFTQFKTYQQSEISHSGANIVVMDSLSVASNADGSVGKIYGTIGFKVTNSNGFTFSMPSSLRPTTQINIVGCAWLSLYNTSENALEDVRTRALTIDTDGTIHTTFGAGYYNRKIVMNISACLLFLKDFGDTPTPE